MFNRSERDSVSAEKKKKWRFHGRLAKVLAFQFVSQLKKLIIFHSTRVLLC